MSHVNDLAGRLLGRLTVLSRAESRGGRALWLCRCACGVEKLVSAATLRKARSCGCSRKGNTKPKQTPSTIHVSGNLALVTLTQGKVAIIDSADVTVVASYRWHARVDSKRPHVWYALTLRDGRTVSMHRLLLGAPAELKVDHKDGDGLNNRRYNIRLATDAQNCFNRATDRGTASGFKGVTFHKKTKKWAARINKQGIGYNLGLFQATEDAARAYDAKARELFGEFARPNFPYSDPTEQAKRGALLERL